MFSKKLHVDVKKSTLKIQDVKKDSATRFKHLKIVLENFDIDEAKGFFEGNFSHVYFILYDCFVSAEANLRQRVHKAHRDELEQVLQLLEKVLTLLPELLNRRWQCHSLARILHKLLHPGNSWKLRRQALRYFMLWYQALGENAPEHIHQMFACLVPGFPPQLSSPNRTNRKRDKYNSSTSEEKEKRDFCDTQHIKSIFHFNNSHQGPVTQSNGPPILPIQSSEKSLDDETVKFFEILLELMVTQVVQVEWRDKHTRQRKCFQFLLERFKATYLRHICPEFDERFSLYKPNLDLPIMRQSMNHRNQNSYNLCKVALIKWLASFTHVGKRDGPFLNLSHNVSSHEEHTDNNSRIIPISHSIDSSSLFSEVPQQYESQVSYDGQTGTLLVREVLYGSRDNVNFVHELYRQAFLLDFIHAGAIRKAISVYKEWIQMTEIPPFMLEPLECHKDKDEDEASRNSDNGKGSSESYRLTRLRNDSYLGAIHRENLFVRAGLQNVLRIFITQASNVFFLENDGCSTSATLLEEQIDSCKRVLNVYRYIVMHAELEPRTWDQLLRVLLQITSLVLGEKSPRRESHGGIGRKLAPAIFQTLIVTWIKANLNVVIFTQLWDQFLEVLTSLTQWEELIREWAKTLDTLTRVLARHVYNLDLNDLPLDRLSEQKKKRKRGGVDTKARSEKSEESPGRGIHQESSTSDRENVSDQPMKEFRKRLSLPRSASDNNFFNVKYHEKLLKFSEQTHFGIPALPSSIEQNMTKLELASRNGSIGKLPAARKQLIGRRAKSLDSIVVMNSQLLTPRCSSPTPSSGVDSNKDSPIQIETIDGSSIDTTDTSETRRSVMAGGGVRGWLPDVAVVLWRRMLSALGDVNSIQDPALHGRVMVYLVQLTQTLMKIRLNQGVSGNNQFKMPAPELVPPLTVIAPWCFDAIHLPPFYEVGKLAAYRLICLLTVQPYDINRSKAHLTLFYRAFHHGVISNDAEIIYALVKYTGSRLFSLNLPGSSLLILDYIYAANVILGSPDIDSPRIEAISILGTLISSPMRRRMLPVLQPNESRIETSICLDIKERIITILLRSCSQELTGVSRCLALSGIAMFVHRELSIKSQHPRVPEAVTVILQSLGTTHSSVAQVACDSLILLCDRANDLLGIYPNVPRNIIEMISETLDVISIHDRRAALTTAMLFCLGEWVIHLGITVLLETFRGKPLLSSIFSVLDNIIKENSNRLKISKNLNSDFGSEIFIDDAAEEFKRKSAQRTNAKTVQLAAKMVMMHLVNHLGHFPMGIGAERLSSMVVESDDVPGIDGDELSSAIFHAPNIQLFMLSDSMIMSLIELVPSHIPYAKSGILTGPSVVRVLLRDLTGKVAWDSSILYCSTHKEEKCQMESSKNLDWIVSQQDEFTVGSNNLLPPQMKSLSHVLRPLNIVPTCTNASIDIDDLDDLLHHIGCTSPEVLTNPEVALNSPENSLQSPYLEGETITAILSQKNSVEEYVQAWNEDCVNGSNVAIPTNRQLPRAPFHYCRLLFSNFGFTGWEQRRSLYLLSKNEKLLRELRNLDGQRSRETHKMAIIYIAHGQEDKNSILGNVSGSKEYESFVARLAWEVELETHSGFLGGLVPGKTSGITAPYFANSFTEVLFHVATRMPLDNPESFLRKTKHLGNDEIHIVWSEHWRDYRRDIIPTEFCDVLIVVYPLPNKFYRIQISKKPDVPFFGPLYDESIVEDRVLPELVRTTALAASRAKRSTLPLFQHHCEERARSIDIVMRNHKESTTFEEFAANVHSPVQPYNLYSGVSSITGSVTSIQSAASSNLAAALLDSYQGRLSLRSSTTSSVIDNRTNTVSDGSRIWFSTDTPDSTALHGISPRPLRKSSFKAGLKHRNSGTQSSTPPDSPRIK